MLRRSSSGLSAYVPKKDLEEPIVATERPELWGGWVRLKNGWVLESSVDTSNPASRGHLKTGQLS